MNGLPYPREPVGRGRGQTSYPNLEFYENRPGRVPGKSHVRRDPVTNNFKLHVRSIPHTWNMTIFRNVFSKCGEPLNMFIQPNRGSSQTWGFVEYEHYQEAYAAVTELNNNIMLGIQVSFAREKPVEDETDPVLKFLISQDHEKYKSTDSLVDAGTKWIKTVKNEKTLSTGVTIEDFHKPVFDAETQKRIEEALFHKILDIYKEGECFTGKCNVCEANCSSACSACTAVYYCSEDCQGRDWPSHSRNCKGAVADDTMTHLRGGGDSRQTNGYGSFDSDNRTNRFADRKNARDSDRGFQRGDNSSRTEQNETSGKRSLFEERRAKAFSSRPKENDRGFQNRCGQNNQRPQNSQESRNLFKPRANTEEADQDWSSPKQDKGDDDSSATTPGLDFINKEKAFLQEIEIKKELITPNKAESNKEVVNRKPEVSESVQPPKEVVNRKSEVTESVQPPKVTSAKVEIDQLVLSPGLELEVLIYFPEDRGLFWVQKNNDKEKVAILLRQLEDHFKTHSSQFSPVIDGICGIHYEGKWYRCQITSLDPLTVVYIDFGYPETVEANRLFALSSELQSLAPFAFKIKLIDGTPESFLDKEEADTFVVQLIEKVDKQWLAQVVTKDTASAEIPKAPTASDEPIAAPALVQASAVLAQTAQPDVATLPIPQPFPTMLDAIGFKTVAVTYPVDTAQKDTYYIGAPTIWNALVEMCAHFKKVIQQCEVVVPTQGTRGLANYMDEWYRVEIISVTPKILAFYIDFGNTEPLEPDGLRQCPKSHEEIPNLVQKIKLARGTSEKYFNLPEASEISVKPVSWVSDNTVVVEVEGEKYTEATSEISTSTAPQSLPAPTLTSPCTATTNESLLTPVEPTVDIQQTAPINIEPQMTPTTPTVDIQQSARIKIESQMTPTTPTVDIQSPTTVQVDPKSSSHLSAVDMLQEKWKISFVPSKVDFIKNSLLGQVYCEHIPSTVSFIVENENYQNYLSSQQFDANFKPCLGEVVGLQLPTGGWERGEVLSQDGLVSLYDLSGVIKSSQLYKLPEKFVNIPSMAAVLTLLKEDLDLLSRLVDEDEIIFDIVKVTSARGSKVVHVTHTSLEGELRTWLYEPLETADPLASGTSVTLSKVLDSNTMLVSPAEDLEIQQAIQIDCQRSKQEFTSPPIKGDYVAFLDKESDGYFRCRIDKVDGAAYTVYAVDDSTYHVAELGDLRPLPKSLRNVSCRVSQIELKGVDKVNLTEEAQAYLSHIVEEDKNLTVTIDDLGKATLTVEGDEETLNNRLKMLLTPKVVPNSDGKITIMSLPELGVPLNQEFNFIVSQTEPLYVQLINPTYRKFTELHNQLQEHCANDNSPYNPCQGELCLALFEGEWYRGRCLRETNTGVSVIMFVDFGNISTTPIKDIRRILPDMVTLPSIATSCKIHGLPDPVPPALKTKLEELLPPFANLSGTFVAEKDGCYEVIIESVKKVLQEHQ